MKVLTKLTATLPIGQDIEAEIDTQRGDIRIRFQRGGKELNLTLQEHEGKTSLYLWEDTFHEDRTVIALDNFWVTKDSDANPSLRGKSLEVETDREVFDHFLLSGR